MIDTDKMRARFGIGGTETDECPVYAVDALCDELDQMREALSRKAIEAGITEAHRDRLAQAIKRFQASARNFPEHPYARSCDLVLDGDLARIEMDFGPLPEAPSDE